MSLCLRYTNKHNKVFIICETRDCEKMLRSDSNELIICFLSHTASEEVKFTSLSVKYTN